MAYKKGNLSTRIQAQEMLTARFGDTWQTKTWEGLTSFDGHMVWNKDNINYYTNNNVYYVLQGSTWNTSSYSPNGDTIWSDGVDYYSFSVTEERRSHDPTWFYTYLNITKYTNGSWLIDSSKIDYTTRLNTFTTPPYIAQDVWSDGINIYLNSSWAADSETMHYVSKVKSGSTWASKSWSGLSMIMGRYIWSDGIHIYYSEGSKQYVLNGDTWEVKTWVGNKPSYGNYVWSDGTHMYYSSGTQQYVLNGDTWEVKSWPGFPSFYGNNIWTAGHNLYYSKTNTQMVLPGVVYYAINTDLEHVIADASNPVECQSSGATLIFSGAVHYELPDTVTVTGADYTWDKLSGTLVLTNVTSNINITITGTPRLYTITTNYEHIIPATSNPIECYGDGATLHFSRVIQYNLPDTITVTGAEYTWDKLSGTLVLTNVTDNVVITISGTPLVGGIDMQVFQNTSEAERMDKTNYLTSVGIINGVLRNGASILNPELTIERDTVDFNYVYIPIFNRYYYVTGVESVHNNLWIISLHVDVLYTYKDTIKLQTAFIDRQENSHDPAIIDDHRVFKQGFDIEEKTLDNDFMGKDMVIRDGYNYVLVGPGVDNGEVVGGNNT